MIFFTLSNPVNFPNWWAVLQSALLSTPKWFFIIVVIFWNIIGQILKSKKAGKS